MENLKKFIYLPLPLNLKSNYLTEVESLLSNATSLYRQNKIKDAYEKLSQSIRLFYSNRLELEKEIITSDLLPLMKRFGIMKNLLLKKVFVYLI